MKGHLYLLPDGYPAIDISRNTDELVRGEIIELSDKFNFAKVDEWEEHYPDDQENSVYSRSHLQCEFDKGEVKTWVYHISPKKLKAQGARRVYSENWTPAIQYSDLSQDLRTIRRF